MSTYFKIITFVTALIASITALAQTPSFEKNLNDAFIKAKKSNKNLLIYRYDSTSIYLSKTNKQNTDDYLLDSLLRVSGEKNIFTKDFVLLPLEINSDKKDEKEFRSELILDFTPDFYVFSPDSTCLAYLKTYLQGQEISKNIIQEIKDSINANNQNRISFEQKLYTNTVSKEELLQIIKKRFLLKLSSLKLLNKYASMEENLTNDLYQFIEVEYITTKDRIVQSFLHEPKVSSFQDQRKMLNRVIAQRVLENAKENPDKIEFENALMMNQNAFSSSCAISLAETLSTNSYLQNEFIQEQLKSAFEYYNWINDTLNIIDYGTRYGNNILRRYWSKQKEYLDLHLLQSDFVSNLRMYSNDDERKAAMKENGKNKLKMIKQLGRDYNEAYSKDLNKIAWKIYQSTKKASSLTTALKFSRFSINLWKAPEQLDTYAHLLFALGKTKEAILYQEMAVKDAKKSTKMYNSIVEEFENELKRFKKASITPHQKNI
ncbi:hypothetical protein ACWA1C_02175 [Flectobacillus roseus]